MSGSEQAPEAPTPAYAISPGFDRQPQGNGRICPLTGFPLGPFGQEWTPSGYPVVDGKYLDLQTGQVTTLKPDEKTREGGPPEIRVWWHNILMAGFTSVSFVSSLSMTHYVIRVGEFLNKAKLMLHSLTATEYTVNVIIETTHTVKEMFELLEDGRLHGPAQYDPPGTNRRSNWYGELGNGEVGELR